MINKVKGYCPEEDKEKEIEISYVSNGLSKIKGLFKCDKAALNECEYFRKNGCCPINDEQK